MNIKTMHVPNYWHEEGGGIATVYRQLLRSAERPRRAMRLVVPGAEDREEILGEFAKIYHVSSTPSRLSAGPGFMPHGYLVPHSPVRRILEAEKADLVEML
jgi:hypothetical protein